MAYKWCIVPYCTNTSIKTPEKKFVSVPTDAERRNLWIMLASRDPNSIVSSSNVFMCEDHFDMPNDMDNYMEHRLMGSVSKVRMKPGCVPTKFECQTQRKNKTVENTNKPCILKKRSRVLIEESIKDLGEKNINTQYCTSPRTSTAAHRRIENITQTQAKSVDESYQECTSHKLESDAIQIKMESDIESSIEVQDDGTVETVEHAELASDEHQPSPTVDLSNMNDLEHQSTRFLSDYVHKVFNFDSSSLTDVDKFKRRLIRSIARFRFVDKLPENKMWEKLYKDTDCDCFMILKRMRALTLKKLNRLLAADDKWENITKVARLTMTDWLLFDLILVHEDVDLIGQDNKPEKKKEPKVLSDLFELVKKYNIETIREPQDLMEAWLFLTLEYNSLGRQCSPMLLQRRWYQMKRATRFKFYTFWYSYRGNPQRLQKNWPNRPTKLLTSVAETLPDIIIKQFPEWEDLIATKKIILREDFEKITTAESVNNKNVADVQIIETPVETIQIDEDSDEDAEKTDKTEKEEIDVRTVKIKKEPTEDVSTAAPHILEEVKHENEFTVDRGEINEFTPTGTETADGYSPDDLFCEEVLPKIMNVTGGVELIESDAEDDLIKACTNVSYEKNKDITYKDTTKSENVPNGCVTSDNKTADYVDDKEDFHVQLDHLVIIDDGIAMEDENIEEYDSQDMIQVKTGTEQLKENAESEDVTSDFDIKLLQTPVVYTKKLDDMDVFKFIDFIKVRDQRIIECSYKESKTIDKKEEANLIPDLISIKEEQKIPDTIDHIELEIGTTSIPEAKEANEHHYDSCDLISNSQKVKYSSWLLQKPKNRSYNPVQLCKNPDFNIRLKRLNAGFIMSERNRLLLKECKPLTVDLHKSFECHLLSGTMYLKNSKFTYNSNTPVHKMNPLKEPRDESFGSNSNVSTETSKAQENKHMTLSNIPTVATKSCENNDMRDSKDTCELKNKLFKVEVSENDVKLELPPTQIIDVKTKKIETNKDIQLNPTSIKLDTCDTTEYIEENHNDEVKIQESTEHRELEQISQNKKKRALSKHEIERLFRKTPINYRGSATPSRIPLKWDANSKPPCVNVQTYINNMYGDALLAEDTLHKMITLLSHQPVESKRKKPKGKVGLAGDVNKISNTDKTKGIEDKITDEAIDQHQKSEENFESKENSDKVSSTNNITKLKEKKSGQTKRARYCCWAREKMTIKDPISRHYCPLPICLCCCKDQLLEKMMQDLAGNKKMPRTQRTSIARKKNKIPLTRNKLSNGNTFKEPPVADVTPIILSDDDDDDYNDKDNNIIKVDYNLNGNDTPLFNSENFPNTTVNNNFTNESNNENKQISEKVLAQNITAPIETKNSSCRETCKTRVYAQNSLNFKNTSTHIEIPPLTVKPCLNINIKFHEPVTPEIINPAPHYLEANVNNNEKVPLSSKTIYNISDPSDDSSKPIFLGKNKILLCSSNKSDSPTPESLRRNEDLLTVGAQSLLPPGVQVVLLPNGELALSIQPGIDFTPVEIAKLSDILIAVQQQLKTTVGNNSITENSETIGRHNQIDIRKECDNEIQTENETNPQTISTEVKSSEEQSPLITKDDNCQNLANMVTNDLGNLVPNEAKNKICGEKEENTLVLVTSNNTDYQTNKKSILSDLMEMSGISENDAASENKIRNAPIKHPDTLMNALPIETALTPAGDISKLLVKSHNSSEARKELSIVSSFAELKKCHDKSCQFYKMDLETGQILPINLKIKKRPLASHSANRQNNSNAGPSRCVIDLTEDQGDAKEITSEPVPFADNVKPIKLIRTIHSTSINKPRTILLKPKQNFLRSQKVVTLSERSLLKKSLNVRKQILQPRIVENNQSEGDCNVISEIHDSDSDDEPLAKKASRKRDDDTAVSDPDRTTSFDITVPPDDVDDSSECCTPEFLEPETFGDNDEDVDCILGV